MTSHYENIKNKISLYYIKKNHLTLMIRLHALLEHGFTLVEAMRFLYSQLNIKNININARFNHLLQQGSTCYELFKFLRFPETVLMQLYFAEQYSALPNTLKQCHTYYKQNQKLMKQFYKSLQYPIILLSIFLILIVILNQTVMPEFQSMYQSMNLKEDALQYTLRKSIQYFPTAFIILIIIILTNYYLFKRWLSKQKISMQIQILSHIPLFHKYYRLFTTYQITNQFALFFKNGITFNQIVYIYSQQNKNHFLQYLGASISNALHRGATLSEVMSQFKCFEPNFISYIEQGEKRDKLDIELLIYSEFLMDHIEKFIKKHISYIQPIMFVLIGLLILSVYLVMMLPIFNMMQTIQN
ncbi:competence type IV pilus assembly protein ComGB [Staphylococcus hyicus]|uniref:competence type IV pilus assembly protein ComGB n=1 Tax=Staphylococcus hyicus TaxID=1284 RepID=UPI002738841C|nr:competence type IV pilus assembly protein ComGB [Staphylococcus hyicus]MDP4460142.1 competence type IV pilus assembly protein ComGB [Staphylococcus hyicus]